MRALVTCATQTRLGKLKQSAKEVGKACVELWCRHMVYAERSSAMRETVMAFSSFAAVLYFVAFPAQFVSVLAWVEHLIR